MVDILILYILSKRDCTVYKIAKLIEEEFGAWTRPSFGTLMPAVKNLETSGFVQQKRILSEGGRASGICSVTPNGLKHLKELILTEKKSNPAALINHIRILLSVSSVLTKEEVLRLFQDSEERLELYIAQIERKLNDEYINYEKLQSLLIKNTAEEAKHLLKQIQTFREEL